MSTEVRGAETHSGHSIKPYIVIFGALSVFTAVSFLANAVFGRNGTSFAIVLGVAVCKATLVGMFFMHLKFDWPRVFFMIIPALILGSLLVIVLLPDMVLAWHH